MKNLFFVVVITICLFPFFAKGRELEYGYSKNSAGHSCIDIMEMNPGAESGNYWVQGASTPPVQAYCKWIDDTVWELFYATSNSKDITKRKSYVELLEDTNGFDLFRDTSIAPSILETETILHGMLPPSLIPTTANVLLIVNEDVWNEDHYFRITFSDPSILRFVLENQISYDPDLPTPQCYHLQHGQYYVVQTDRYEYYGTSLAITKEGIGIRDCYKNHLSIHSNIKDLSDRISSTYSKDYSKPDLFPTVLFGNIYSNDVNEAIKFIAGTTKLSIVNKLRVYFSSIEFSNALTFFRHVFPDPSNCPPFPSSLSCSCIPRNQVQRNELQYAMSFTILPITSDINSTLSQCSILHTFSHFETVLNSTVSPSFILDNKELPYSDSFPIEDFIWLFQDHPNYNNRETIPLTRLYDSTEEAFIYSSSSFYPMSTTTDITTLREIYLGVTCWFSTEFLEFYKVNRLRAQWLEFQTDNDIIIFVNQQFVYSSFQEPNPSSRKFFLSPYIASLQNDYFAIHVFLVSRSCSSSLDSQFIWKTSAPPVTNHLMNANSKYFITSLNSITGNGVWIDGYSLQYHYDDYVQFTLPWNYFYQIAFSIQLPTETLTTSDDIVVPASIRQGISLNTLDSSPCSISSTSIAFFIQSSKLSIILQNPSYSSTYLSYDSDLNINILNGKLHALKLDYHFLYQFILIEIDDQRVFMNEDFIKVNDFNHTIVIQSQVHLPITLSTIEINTMEITADDLQIRLYSLYTTSTVVGTNASFDIMVKSNVLLKIPPAELFDSLVVEIKGQKTNNTVFTDCSNMDSENSWFPSSFFSICISTTIADSYDLYIYYKGNLISNAPCFACIDFVVTPINVANTLVEGLSSTLTAGESMEFTITLRDNYNNTIPSTYGYIIKFTNNNNHYITYSIDNSPSYQCTLFSNHTHEFSFQIIINDIIFNTEPYVISIITTCPSYLSTMKYIASTEDYSTISSIIVHIQLNALRYIPIAASKYALSLRIVKEEKEEHIDYLYYDYDCHYENLTNVTPPVEIYVCTLHCREPIDGILYAYIGEITDHYQKRQLFTTYDRLIFANNPNYSGSNEVAILNDIQEASLILSLPIHIHAATVDCSHLNINISFHSFHSVVFFNETGQLITIVNENIQVFINNQVAFPYLSYSSESFLFLLLDASTQLRNMSDINVSIRCNDVVEPTNSKTINKVYSIYNHQIIDPAHCIIEHTLNDKTGIDQFRVYLKDYYDYSITTNTYQVVAIYSTPSHRSVSTIQATFNQTFYAFSLQYNERGNYHVSVYVSNPNGSPMTLYDKEIFYDGGELSLYFYGEGTEVPQCWSDQYCGGTIYIEQRTAANDIVPFTDMNMNLTMQVIQEIADDVIRTLSVTYDSSLYRYVLEYSFFQISPANSYTLYIYHDNKRIYDYKMNNRDNANINAQIIMTSFVFLPLLTNERYEQSVKSGINITLLTPVSMSLNELSIIGYNCSVMTTDFKTRLEGNSFYAYPMMKQIGDYYIHIYLRGKRISTQPILIRITQNTGIMAMYSIWGKGNIGGIIGEQLDLYVMKMDIFGNILDPSSIEISIRSRSSQAVEYQIQSEANWKHLSYTEYFLQTVQYSDSIIITVIDDNRNIPLTYPFSSIQIYASVMNFTKSIQSFDHVIAAGHIYDISFSPVDNYNNAIPVSSLLTQLNITVYDDKNNLIAFSNRWNYVSSFTNDVFPPYPMNTNQQLLIHTYFYRKGCYYIHFNQLHYNDTIVITIHVTSSTIEPSNSHITLEEIDSFTPLITLANISENDYEAAMNHNIALTNSNRIRYNKTSIVSKTEFSFHLHFYDMFGNSVDDFSDIEIILLRNYELHEYDAFSVFQNTDDSFDLFIILSTPGLYSMFIVYQYIPLTLTPMYFTIIPEHVNYMSIYNDFSTCSKSSSTPCGIYGTRDTVETGFMTQIITSYSNIIQSSYFDVHNNSYSIQFINQEDSSYYYSIHVDECTIHNNYHIIKEYYCSYHTMSYKTPSLLGEYQVDLFDNTTWLNPSYSISAYLFPGPISFEKSICYYHGCKSQDESCFVACILRDEHENVIVNMNESLILHVRISNIRRVHHTAEYAVNITMTEINNGTFIARPSIQYAGDLIMTVEDSHSHTFFSPSFSYHVLPSSLQADHSFLNTIPPSIFPVNSTLHLELVLTDKNDNIFCSSSYPDFFKTMLVTLEIEIDCYYNSIGKERYSIPFISNGSCENNQSIYSLYVDYQFVQFGTAILKIKGYDTIKQESYKFHNDIRMTIDPLGCSQGESKTFQCYKYPQNEELESRNFQSTCSTNPRECNVGIDQDSRCNDTQSYCWGYREFFPLCTSALSSDLECYCITNKCSTGQCYRSSSYCPIEITCPDNYVACSDYHCVKDKKYCSSMVACPTSTVLCGDLRHCGLSREECFFMSIPSCPINAPLVCWDGTTCVNDYHNCPSMPQCPENQVRCENRVCKDSVNECTVSQPCPADKPLRCSDGTCSSVENNICPSSITCPDGYYLSTDHRCISHKGHTMKFLSSSGSCPSHMIACADGTCATTQALCPSSIHCPYGMILCSDFSCRPSIQDCPVEKDYCLPPLILCPNKQCVSNIEDCSQGITCPLERPILCHNLICEETVEDCVLNENEFFAISNTSSSFSLTTRLEAKEKQISYSFSTSLILDEPVCPKAFPYFCASMNHCVNEPDDCPFLAPCPMRAPFRCFDGRCVADSFSCPSFDEYKTTFTCPMNMIYCLYYHRCVKASSFCPTLRVCNVNEYLCSDGTCASLITDITTKPDYLTMDNLVGSLWYSFLIGTDIFKLKEFAIQLQVENCISNTKNNENFYLRCCNQIECSGIEYEECMRTQEQMVEKECQAKFLRYPCDENCEENTMVSLCPLNKKRCFDGRCIDFDEECPDVTVCPRDRPIRCMNNQCVLSRQQCEVNTKCIEGYVLCEDGSCAHSYNECSSIQCPPSSPYLCWDQSCRRSIDDCPTIQACSNDTYFCGILGRCVYDRSSCVSNHLIITPSTYNSYPFCYSKYLCPDGSCRASQFDCPSVSCSFPTSILCPDGQCVSTERDCISHQALISHSTDNSTSPSSCPQDYPFICSDGSCVKKVTECVGTSFCPPPFKRCANGLCLISLSLCPVLFPTMTLPTSMNENEPVLQFIPFTQVSPFIQQQYNHGFMDTTIFHSTNHSIICPANTPFLCASGDCVLSSHLCPTITPCSSSLLHNGGIRCLDRTCTYDIHSCSNRTVCPTHLPYMCQEGIYSGMCVMKEEDCFNEDGCPLNKPYKCMNGQCVQDSSQCIVNRMANGCPLNKPYKCISNKCVATKEECTLINGCSPTNPFKHQTGECSSASTQSQSTQSTCPSDKPILCWDNTCVQSIMQCPLHNGCSVATPNHCASGECAGYLGQYPFNLFVPILGIIDPIITKESISNHYLNSCSSTPVCPPDEPFLCADKQCVADSSLCKPCQDCDQWNDDLPFCPSTRPIRCLDGSCVLNQGDCFTTPKCPPNEPYSCFHGGCASIPSRCVYDNITDLEQVFVNVTEEIKEINQVSQTKYVLSSLRRTLPVSLQWWWESENQEEIETYLPYSFTLCSNGIFADIANCPPIPACSPYKPKRCPSGECVGLNEECSAVFPYSSNLYGSIIPLSYFFYPLIQTKENHIEYTCIKGQLCSDGICRVICPVSSGCGINMIQCPDGTCVNSIPGLSDYEVCKGLGNCGINEYRCFYGYCSEKLETCFENHYYHHIVEEATISISSSSSSSILLYSTQHEVLATLSIPASSLQPSQFYFLHIEPVAINLIQEGKFIIQYADRAKELHLEQSTSAGLLQMSAALSLNFIALDNQTKIEELNEPLVLSLILHKKARYLPLSIYDTNVYQESTDVRDDEYCPAHYVFYKWSCLDPSEYIYENGVFKIKIRKAEKIMIMVNPKEPVNIHSVTEVTTVSLFISYIESTAVIVILLIIIFVIWIVYLQRYRLRWEESKDSFSIMRVRTDVGGILGREINNTEEWKQIDITSGVAKRNNMKQNPLAVRRAKETMFQQQLNRMQMTTKKNAQTIHQLRSEKDDLIKQIKNLTSKLSTQEDM